MSVSPGILGLDYNRIRDDVQLYMDELCDGELVWYPRRHLMNLLDEKDPAKWDPEEYTVLDSRLTVVKAMTGVKRKIGDLPPLQVQRTPRTSRQALNSGFVKRFSQRVSKAVKAAKDQLEEVDPPSVPYSVDPMGPCHSPSNICFAQMVRCGPEGKRQVVLDPVEFNTPTFPVELILGRAILRVYRDINNPYPRMPYQMVEAINTMNKLVDPWRRRKVAITHQIADLITQESEDELSDLHLKVHPFPPTVFAYDQEGTRWFIVTLVGERMRRFLDLAFGGVFDDDGRVELRKWKKATENKGGALWTFALELSSLWGTIPPWDQRCALFRTTHDFLKAFHSKEYTSKVVHDAEEIRAIHPGESPPIFIIFKTDKLGIIVERTTGIKQYIEGMFDMVDPRFKEKDNLEQLDSTNASDQSSSSSSSSSSSAE